MALIEQIAGYQTVAQWIAAYRWQSIKGRGPRDLQRSVTVVTKYLFLTDRQLQIARVGRL